MQKTGAWECYWYNMASSVVLILPTSSDPETIVMVTRKTGKAKGEINIFCPKAVQNYTLQSMWGADLVD